MSSEARINFIFYGLVTAQKKDSGNVNKKRKRKVNTNHELMRSLCVSIIADANLKCTKCLHGGGRVRCESWIRAGCRTSRLCCTSNWISDSQGQSWINENGSYIFGEVKWFLERKSLLTSEHLNFKKGETLKHSVKEQSQLM